MQKFNLSMMREVKEVELPALRKKLAKTPARSRSSYRFIPRVSGITIIAEVKKCSPTEKLKLDADVSAQAQAYARGGAQAISVLVDGNYFSGSYEDMQRVANAVTLPVLCKEFVYFTEQIELAYRYGADLVLLIAQVLSDKELQELYDYAIERSIVPIVEINSSDEIERVMAIDPEIVMVNMRNLNTLVIDLTFGSAVLKEVPSSVIRISASGIKSVQDVKSISSVSGVDTFLIGSALMKSGDPADFIKELSDVS